MHNDTVKQASYNQNVFSGAYVCSNNHGDCIINFLTENNHVHEYNNLRKWTFYSKYEQYKFKAYI